MCSMDVEPDSPGREWPKLAPPTRNTRGPSGVYSAMKRDSSGLLAITLRTGLMVALAMILILVLLPAVVAAQAAGLR